MSSEPIRSAFSDDPEMAEIVVRFVAHLPAQVGALEAAAADGAALRTLAHQMSGAAGSFGFPQISAAAARLEAALEERAPAAAETALGELLALCRRVAP